MNEQFRKASVREIVAELEALLRRALPQVEGNLTTFLPMSSVRSALFDLRRKIVSDDFGVVIVQAGGETYDRLGAEGAAMGTPEIRRELLNNIVRSVMDHAVFGAKRSELMREMRRSAPDELQYERELNVEVLDRLAATFDRIITAPEYKAPAAPRRRAERIEFTLERLHAPLTNVQ